MNILLVATKAPWPPVDGGRFLLLNTLEALAVAGCRLTLVAPVDPAGFDLGRVARELSPWCTPVLVPAAPLPAVAALLRPGGAPLSIARHSLQAVRSEVERQLGAERFDVVHAEQLQALPQAAPAFSRGIPVVLRAQNVESDLWRAAAERGRGMRGWLLRQEARRMAAWEGTAVRRAAATLALTREDAARLGELAKGGGRVRVVRAPFPELPPGSGRLDGAPPVVVFGSRGWLPNVDSVAWYLKDVWPAVRAELPGAVLHLYEEASPSAPPGVVVHPPPGDSAEAFPPGSILAVPLRIASGVRIKILEAWARGVPVVATPAALAGLEAEDGRQALVAEQPRDFAAAIRRLHTEPGLAAALVQEGLRARRERHDPGEVARRLLDEYGKVP
ncbi:MAG TPA: glycosyltransferase family 4 protein [Thermoanaerobaculia bacterium]|nr:glycosyltransferase family 4 protein [Thermoanaerobaculia bacterium]